MAKEAEEYLEHAHGDIDPANHYKPTLKEDMEQAEKNRQTAEEKQQELLEKTAERYWLEDDDIEDFLCESYADKESAEYLVDGAILTCTNCTREDVYIKDKRAGSGQVTIEKIYKAALDPSIDDSMLPDNDIKVFGRLKVTENLMANSNGLMHATIKDCIRGKNIPSFGNCLRGPDCIWEEDIFQRLNDEGNTKKRGGTCKYLMRLESEWENYEIGQEFQSFNDDVHGNKTGITMTSILFCKHGGFIYPVTSGQTESQMTLEEALQIMTRYLKGEEITEEQLNKIIEFVANNCGLKVNDIKKGQFKIGDAYGRSKMFDNQILAWTYYWNKKIKNEFSYQFEIDPNIVKAIIAEESSFGDGSYMKSKNPSRNVMQSLSTGNSTVWIAAGINPFDTFAIDENISYKMLDGTIKTDGSLPIYDNLKFFNAEDLKEERKNYYFQDFDVIKKIFEEDANGKYMVVFEKVTPNMSIATGIGLLAKKIEIKKSIYFGIYEYNTNPGYVEKINGHLEDLGCSEVKATN